MQRLRTKSQVRLFDKDILPTLKGNSASFMGRNILSLSKFDLDSNLVINQQRKLQGFNKIQSIQNKQKNKSKMKRNFIQNGISIEQAYKISTSDSKRQTNHQNFQDFTQKKPSKNIVTIQSSKTSTKSYGQIKGYAANSHPGPFNIINQDRICIVTNLNKTSVKQKQVSFFSIYDGCNGLLKTDYFRDHFHLLLNSDQNLLAEPQKAIKSTIQKIQKNLSSQLIYIDDGSKVSYSIMVIIGQTSYFVVSGDCRVTISKKFGFEIEKINANNVNITNNIINKLENVKKIFLKKQEAINVCIKKVQFNEQIDFIVLGSEGIYENMKDQEIVKKLWGYMLKNKMENVHNSLGDSIYQLMQNIFGLPSTKNASLIMLGFKNIQQCFKKQDKIQLPYCQN